MEGIIHFHDITLLLILSISILLIGLLRVTATSSLTYRSFTESQTVEMFWTLIPAVLLVALVLPSLRLLYFVDGITDHTISVKALGHQ